MFVRSFQTSSRQKAAFRAVLAQLAVSRVLTGLLGALALVLQLLAPSFSSASEGEWIEICSEAGAIIVQVDLSGDADQPSPTGAPCPECADCVLCATCDVAAPGAVPVIEARDLRVKPVQPVLQTSVPVNPAQLWPETRGPPLAPENRIERVVCASMASTLTTGGAPWS
jgi:hypothetical protein